MSESLDFKYKSRIGEIIFTDEDGTKRNVKQKVVVYWSRKFYERERYENKSFIEFIEKLITNPNGFRVSAVHSKCLNEWQNRPLDSIYPVVFFDGIVFNSRKDNKMML